MIVFSHPEISIELLSGNRNKGEKEPEIKLALPLVHYYYVRRCVGSPDLAVFTRRFFPAPCSTALLSRIEREEGGSVGDNLWSCFSSLKQRRRGSRERGSSCARGELLGHTWSLQGTEITWLCIEIHYKACSIQPHELKGTCSAG